ncbi:AmmeMemoRadiSam system protein A [Alkalimarinus sediminis]|uniref:AmmeMemoRadiSam system protein A n=2 Tax=Alkalimarinus sediminis TaxID=1632866 RepID=A0A9E8HJN6_9ALTE|nr:AmmeMemoRadiSam system protein A [Alkalimarinus sediminis]UZW73908.1 AmmeMemoRadiSam system protein A [Alkalimarinus sediminis]
MVHMPSVELSLEEQSFLKRVVKETIRIAAMDGRNCPLSHFESDLQGMPNKDQLLVDGACFITLLKRGSLRGCIGTLDAYRPLLQDVASNAYSAAMSDPRFPPVTVEELELLELSISVLTNPQEIFVTTEADLASALEPNVDGLIIQDGRHRATYLPSVWEQLPERTDFIRELKSKAGLSQNYWSSTIRCFKYQVQSIK